MSSAKKIKLAKDLQKTINGEDTSSDGTLSEDSSDSRQQENTWGRKREDATAWMILIMLSFGRKIDMVLLVY